MSIRTKILPLALLAISLPAQADNFICILSTPGGVRVASPAHRLPSLLRVSFDSQGKSMTLVNSETPGFLNCTLPIEDRIGQGQYSTQLFFSADNVEGVRRYAVVEPLSVEGFLMNLSGSDAVTPGKPELSSWQGSYQCTLTQKPKVF